VGSKASRRKLNYFRGPQRAQKNPPNPNPAQPAWHISPVKHSNQNWPPFACVAHPSAAVLHPHASPPSPRFHPPTHRPPLELEFTARGAPLPHHWLAGLLPSAHSWSWMLQAVEVSVGGRRPMPRCWLTGTPPGEPLCIVVGSPLATTLCLTFVLRSPSFLLPVLGHHRAAPLPLSIVVLYFAARLPRHCRFQLVCFIFYVMMS
jgi:hypothetical protein